MTHTQIPLPPSDERKKVVEDVDRDRRYSIDAAIVRTMKSRKALQHQQVGPASLARSPASLAWGSCSLGETSSRTKVGNAGEATTCQCVMLPVRVFMSMCTWRSWIPACRMLSSFVFVNVARVLRSIHKFVALHRTPGLPYVLQLVCP